MRFPFFCPISPSHVVITSFPHIKTRAGIRWSLQHRIPLVCVVQTARRCAASSSASSLFSLISASVRTKRVHSSFRGTASCYVRGGKHNTGMTFTSNTCMFIDNVFFKKRLHAFMLCNFSFQC